MPSLCFGATYYVTQTGTAAIGSTTGCEVANSASIAAFNANAGSFSGTGDTVHFGVSGGDFTTGATIDDDNMSLTNCTGESPVFTGMATCVASTDDDGLTISNITCEDITSEAIDITVTANLSDITITNVTLNNLDASCIKLRNGTDGVVVSNLTITDNTVSGFSQGGGVDCFDLGVLLPGDFTAFERGDISNGLISGNVIDGKQTTGGADAILIVNPINVIIEYNDITSGSHGIHTAAPGAVAVDCTGTIARYNYIHGSGDDPFWVQGCADATEMLIYGNITVDSGDDCIETSASGTAGYYNNTCANPGGNGIELAGAGAEIISKNNIFYFKTAPCSDCDGGSGTAFGHHFVALTNATEADSVFDSNIYYTPGSYTHAFRSANLNGGTAIDFTTWQGDANVDDSESYILDPNLNTNDKYKTNDVSVARWSGEDLSALGVRLVRKSSTWPDDVRTVAPINFHRGAWTMPDIGGIE